MSDRERTVLLMILAVLSLACVLACTWVFLGPVPSRDSISGIAAYHGVSEESVRVVARAYGVDPRDIASYGEKPFPVNYLEHALGWQGEQAETPVVHRKEVESLVTGYVSRCEIADTITLYLYYSSRLRPKTLFKGEALPVEVSYKLDPQRNGIHDDQVLEQITFYEINDSGGWSWEQVAPNCVPPAAY
jgi:hypothetical protein